MVGRLFGWTGPTVISVPFHHCGFDVNIGFDPISPRIRVSEDGSKVWVVFLDMFYSNPKLMIAMSRDSGKTWIAPQPVAHPAFGSDAPLVQSWGNGNVYALDVSREVAIGVWRSTDGGETWTFQDTTGRRPVYASLSLQDESTLHLVMGDNDTALGVYYQRSFDGGVTWEPRKRILKRTLVIGNGDTTEIAPIIFGGGFVLCAENYTYLLWSLEVSGGEKTTHFSLICLRSETNGENFDTLLTINHRWITLTKPQIDPVTGSLWLFTTIDHHEGYEWLMSEDYGETWLPLAVDFDTQYQYIQPQFCVYDNHIFVVYRRDFRHIYFTASPDGGNTWTPPELLDSLNISAGQMGIPDLEVVPLGDDSFLIHVVYAEVDTMPGEPGIYGRIIYRRSERRVSVEEVNDEGAGIPRVRWRCGPEGVRFLLPEALLGEGIFIVDVTGRVIWRRVAVQSREFLWRGETTAGGVAPSGVYSLGSTKAGAFPTRFLYIKP